MTSLFQRGLVSASNEYLLSEVQRFKFKAKNLEDQMETVTNSLVGDQKRSLMI